MTTLYDDGRYLSGNPTWHAEDSAWKAGHILKMLERNRIHPRSVCELGCGAGEVIGTLASQLPPGISFTGYEVSPQAHELCARNTQENVRYILGDLLAAPDVFFDVVLAIDVFEHVEDYLGFLRGLRTKGTYKVFHIPLDLSVQSVLRRSRLLNERSRVGHLHYFTKETALATLADTGYEIVEYIYTNGALDLPVSSTLARIGKIPRRLLSFVSKDLAARLLGGFSLLVLAT